MMKPERWQQIEPLYHAALERESEARAAFLDEACAGDAELRHEVESLLAVDERAAHFIDQPAVEFAAQGFAEEQSTMQLGQRISHYQLLSRLGKGGMGEVFLAQDTSLKRQVALKLLPKPFMADAERVHRFEQEARAASALNHPNILTIHEIGRTDDTHFIVTEYIQGQTLRQQMKATRMNLPAALDVAIQIATALVAAHEAHIIHRDIKPENVMMRRDGLVKVLDFGLAKLIEMRKADFGRRNEDAETLVQSPDGNPQSAIRNPQSTMPGIVMGTPRYMSPEQARGEKVDARTDIFSLGVMLYEMLAGRAPFSGATPSDVMAAILRDEPPPLTDDMPRELDHIISQALRKERAERFQTAKELLTSLQELKRRLELQTELARAGQPESSNEARENNSSEPIALATAPAAAARNGEDTAVRTTSAAVLWLSQVKRHKLAALLALLLLLAVVASSFLYLNGQKTEAAIDSIAVLPFTNQNRDAETEYLSDGLTESIINNLTQLPALRVIARNSAFRFKGKEDDPLSAGQALGVRAVVVGRVLQRGENLIVSAELVDVRDNKQLWGQQYNNRKLSDIFAVQGEIAKEISEALRLKLTGAERQQLAKRPTENLKAFQYYMQGRAYAQRRTRDDLLEAIRYCEKAIAEDRNYALAYAGLADAYGNLGSRGYIAPLEGRRKLEEAARKALTLDENLAEAHIALSQTYTLFAPFNFSLSDRESRRAIEISPSLAMAHYILGNSLLRQGRLDESIAEYLKARELDPLSPTIAKNVAHPYYLKRDYGRALELLRQANELGSPFNTTWEIGVYLQTGDFDKMLVELEQAKRERKNDPLLIYNTGMVYAAQGKRGEALQIIKELDAMSGASLSQATYIAKIYAVLNEKELALTWLERGLAAGAIGPLVMDEPVWDTIRSDARFGDLRRRMGFPP